MTCAAVAFVLLVTCGASAVAHEVQGSFGNRGRPVEVPRMAIPFDSSTAVPGGRVYVLWLAEDGAFVFFLENPREPVKLELSAADPRFRLWLVRAEKRLRLPAGFEQLSSDEKSHHPNADELVGRMTIDWRSELDYVIALDVRSADRQASFRGCLFGNPKNAPPKK